MKTIWLVLALTTSLTAEVKWVTFVSEPECKVLLEVSSNQPYVLGPSNQPVAVDLELFDGSRDVRVTFHRDGWLDQTRTLQSAPARSRHFSTFDRFPAPGQGAVLLEPKTDLSSRWLQLRYFLSRHGTGLLVVLGGMLVAGAFMRRHWTRLRRELHRSRDLDALAAGGAQAEQSLQIIGGYRLLEPLGRGGMATVYRAVPDATLDPEQAVAIKLLRDELLGDPEHRKRMQREAKVLRSLDHPNLLRIVDWGEQGVHFYLVMEMLQGRNFADLLVEHPGGLPRDLLLRHVLPLARGLAHAHAQGIVHRDLKPDNLFLTDAGLAKVVDFGIARGNDFTRATGTDVVTGTPTYLAPEQLDGVLAPCVDQYSLGVVLFELLTAQVPFVHPDPFVVAVMHRTNLPPSPRSCNPEVSEEVAAVVLRMMAKNPARRYPDIVAAAEAFTEVLAETGAS